MPVAPVLGEGLIARTLRIADEDVVWLRGVLDGYEGLAVLFGDGSGTVILATPADRERELDDVLADLQREAPFVVVPNSHVV